MNDAQVEMIKKVLDSHLDSHIKQIEESREHTNDIIKAIIKETVNGKIDRLSVGQQEIIKTMDAFIMRANPAVVFFENITWSKKFILGGIIFVTAVVALLAAIRGLIKI